MSADGPSAEPTGDAVPVQDWIPHPVSDSADYLDGEPPLYGDSLTGEAKADFDAAIAAREGEKPTPSPKPKPQRRSRRKKKPPPQ